MDRGQLVVVADTPKLDDALLPSTRNGRRASRTGRCGVERTLRDAGQRFTARHYMKALDFERSPDGGYVRQAEEWRIYVPLFWRTLKVSLGVTLLCLVIGYPMAHLIANSPPGRANLLLVLVLLPFWTSLLVRTTSWIVLLQTQGVINDFLVAIGLIGDEGRIAMIYNMTGTFIAMTHVLLPFLVLPLYSVMRSIPPAYMNAAASLGANPIQALRRVYWPQTVFGAPFVVITVSATLAGFDWTVMRAAANLGANPLVAFRRVQLPLILPGVISGSLFAFAASFDELVIVLFMGGLEQRTLPRQMWSGIREEISPTLLAVATFLIVFALLALSTVEWLRRRGGTAGTMSGWGEDLATLRFPTANRRPGTWAWASQAAGSSAWPSAAGGVEAGTGGPFVRPLRCVWPRCGVGGRRLHALFGLLLRSPNGQECGHERSLRA